ncbi:MAG: type II secretion system protein F [Gammaproteobacteria bacterium]|nr:MAG: type II secretion system protein F [Gammaproteobacteria bacterium]PIE36752.1 MAG: type II secretion system protein F [Gammaproteobacteria bacterium]
MATKAASSNIMFEWEGKNAKGAKQKGIISSPSAELVKARLRRQGIIPTKIRKQRQTLGRGSKITPSDIALFARQLTTMMGAGVPMVQAFEIVGNGVENKAMRDMIADIKTEVESGSNLTNALRKHPEQFDNLFCSLTEAGEQSGTLESLLGEIATYKEKSESLKKKIKKAMFYPVAVLIVAFIVTAILLVFVVPQFESLFEGMGGDLPAFTQMIVHASEWMQKWWYVMFGGIGVAVWGFIEAKKRSRAFSELLDRLALKAPVFGEIVVKSAIARFARTLATMSKAGVPLVEAMDSVAGVAGNSVFERAILKMKDEAATGQNLQTSIQNSGLFSNMVVQMVAIGEESGSIDDMLSKVADYYEEEVDNAVDAMTSLMEPMIMAFLGVVIGGLVVGMYLPIFKMGDAF